MSDYFIIRFWRGVLEERTARDHDQPCFGDVAKQLPWTSDVSGKIIKVLNKKSRLLLTTPLMK